MKQLSKALSWLLRHGALECQLDLDPEGYASLDAVIDILRARGVVASREEIMRLVAAGDPLKQRFSIVGAEIRANYGHSAGIEVRYVAAIPPHTLFHGTTAAALAQIQCTGLQPMQREFVHLTTEIALAKIVAMRRGAPLIILVDTAGAYAAGVAFHHANSNFWLSKSVPAKFLSLYSP